jgi:hypothetical protein
VRHREVGMLVQMVVKRTCPTLLGAGDNEVQTLYFLCL